MWFFFKKAPKAPKVPQAPKDGPLTIRSLWDCKDEALWKKALAHYYELLNENQAILDRQLDALDSATVKNLSTEGFYAFLHDEYFVWKYTQKNRLATTRRQLERYITENRMDELAQIKTDLFNADHRDPAICLEIVSRVRGLGPSGASGLLSILFPEDFGTVDQFLVKSLLKVEPLKERDLLSRMKPEMLSLKDSVLLTRILRQKADEMNRLFHTRFWTPRKLDMILWSIER